jgi:hypothetical protein
MEGNWVGSYWLQKSISRCRTSREARHQYSPYPVNHQAEQRVAGNPDIGQYVTETNERIPEMKGGLVVYLHCVYFWDIYHPYLPAFFWESYVWAWTLWWDGMGLGDWYIVNRSLGVGNDDTFCIWWISILMMWGGNVKVVWVEGYVVWVEG